MRKSFLYILCFVVACQLIGCGGGEEQRCQSKLDFAKYKDRNPLPRGSYYTQFELNLNAQGETLSGDSKGIVCKKVFTIE